MSKYIELAKEKFNRKKTVDYELPLEDFVADCYSKLNPCSYGVSIEEKIRKDFGFSKIPAKLDCGDLSFNGKNFEVKVSFLSNVTPTWCLTHIRPWHRLDYYLLCFIDCSNDFKPMFFVLPKVRINQLKLGSMAGTQKTNSENHNLELRVSINKSSKEFKSITRWNLLETTDKSALTKFISERG